MAPARVASTALSHEPRLHGHTHPLPTRSVIRAARSHHAVAPVLLLLLSHFSSLIVILSMASEVKMRLLEGRARALVRHKPHPAITKLYLTIHNHAPTLARQPLDPP